MSDPLPVAGAVLPEPEASRSVEFDSPAGRAVSDAEVASDAGSDIGFHVGFDSKRQPKAFAGATQLDVADGFGDYSGDDGSDHGQRICVDALDGAHALMAEQGQGLVMVTAADRVAGAFSLGFADSLMLVCHAPGCVGLAQVCGADPELATSLQAAIGVFRDTVGAAAVTVRLGYGVEGMRRALLSKLEHQDFAAFCADHDLPPQKETPQARQGALEQLLSQHTETAIATAIVLDIEPFVMATSAVFVSLDGEIDTFEDLTPEQAGNIHYDLA
ncbi:hypothetical protein WG922_08480 [Ramlibacter sp. AN1015]|uniref:hypothetical protein n=1 Tax=Ramlibacter sp. AN1015 TaxID=3133428 RepID=UPI0030C21972